MPPTKMVARDDQRRRHRPQTSIRTQELLRAGDGRSQRDDAFLLAHPPDPRSLRDTADLRADHRTGLDTPNLPILFFGHLHGQESPTRRLGLLVRSKQRMTRTWGEAQLLS